MDPGYNSPVQQHSLTALYIVYTMAAVLSREKPGCNTIETIRFGWFGYPPEKLPRQPEISDAITSAAASLEDTQ